MKITIASEEIMVSRSLFKKEKGYRMLLTVEFSEVEFATIRKSNLESGVVRYDTFVGPNGEFQFPIKIGDLLKGTVTRVFDTPIKAKNFDAELRQTDLPNLKAYLEQNSGVEAKSESFDL